MDNNNKNSHQLNVESKYLSFNYRKKIIILKYLILCNILLSYKVADYMAYEENFLSYLINLEKDNKNIKLKKLNFGSGKNGSQLKVFRSLVSPYLSR